MINDLYEQEHEDFRAGVIAFLERECVPHHEKWEADGIVDRDVWRKAGEQGLLGLQLDEEYGGGGTPDFRYNVVIGEEMTRRGVYGPAFTLFNDMIVPYLVSSANDEQKARWFPRLASGELIAAIVSPAHRPGNQRSRCSSVALAARYGTIMSLNSVNAAP